MMGRVFIHEVGHAVTAILGGATVSEIRIWRGRGRTFWRARKEIDTIVPIMLGGIAAEWLVFGISPWGACHSDVAAALAFIHSAWPSLSPSEQINQVAQATLQARQRLETVGFPRGLRHLEKRVRPGSYYVVKGHKIVTALGGLI